MESIRAVTNSSNEVISAYDYDAWGYKLREWKSGDDSKYRFTGKERDYETNYDYFGARYYDSRIGRWGGVEPKYDKYIGFTPYNFAGNNSMILVDIDGNDPRRSSIGGLKDVLKIINDSPDKSYEGLMNAFNTEKKGRYIYTLNEGLVDMRHFFAAALHATYEGEIFTKIMGLGQEFYQSFTNLLRKNKSWFAPDDPHSNDLGIEYGYVNQYRLELDIKEFTRYLKYFLHILDPNDPRISEEFVDIPDEGDDELPKRFWDFVGSSSPFWGMDPNNKTVELVEFPQGWKQEEK